VCSDDGVEAFKDAVASSDEEGGEEGAAAPRAKADGPPAGGKETAGRGAAKGRKAKGAEGEAVEAAWPTEGYYDMNKRCVRGAGWPV
jgi:hypothetical protein